MKKVIPCLLFFLVVQTCYAQSVTYYLEFEEVNAPDLPALQSFAKAQWGPYWLLIAGRTDGLHTLFPNSAFPASEQNYNAFVIDTNSWQVWTTPITNLEYQKRTSLSAVNTEFYQSGNYLYILGGYGYDSLTDNKITFPTLTAINVSDFIDNIQAGGNNIAGDVRQISDTLFQVAGGRLEKLGDTFYLIGGQKFSGLYTKQNSDFFVQHYTNNISCFKLNDDGQNISISNLQNNTDTVNFHRRDLNSAPTINSNSEEGIGIYGGVFTADKNLPYLNPIYISNTTTTIDYSFDQAMNQYTCAVIAMYDSVAMDMHSIFLGGISLNDYIDSTQEMKYDTLVPFVDDISVLIHHANGTSEESILPTKFPVLGGANSEFFLNKNIPHFGNGVIKLDKITDKTLLGYVYGGIMSSAGNDGSTSGMNSTYRIYLHPNFASSVSSTINSNSLTLFPNPAIGYANIVFTKPHNAIESIVLFDLLGKEIKRFNKPEQENNFLYLNTSNVKAGIYSLMISTEKENYFLKLAVAEN